MRFLTQKSMSKFPLPPNSRSPTWNVTVILSSLCSCSWKHSRECARSWMLCASLVPQRRAMTRERESRQVVRSEEGVRAMVSFAGWSSSLEGYRRCFNESFGV